MGDAKDAPRAVRECLDTLDDEAFGAATTTKPKFTAHADPASQWTAARKGPAFFAHSTSYLIDTDHSIIVDVDASRSNRTAEVGAMCKMLDRSEERFGIKPDWIAADTAYGATDNLGWLTLERKFLPFIPVFDKGERKDGTFSRFDDENDRYICPGGKEMLHTRRNYLDPARNAPVLKARNYRALNSDCTGCELKAKSCPNAERRSVHREKYEVVRDFARVSQPRSSIRRLRPDARRSKCSSHISNVSSDWAGSDYVAHVASSTSLPSPPLPKTSENWPNVSQW
jgi:hypothetical protein